MRDGWTVIKSINYESITKYWNPILKHLLSTLKQQEVAEWPPMKGTNVLTSKNSWMNHPKKKKKKAHLSFKKWIMRTGHQ